MIKVIIWIAIIVPPFLSLWFIWLSAILFILVWWNRAVTRHPLEDEPLKPEFDNFTDEEYWGI